MKKARKGEIDETNYGNLMETILSPGNFVLT